MSISCRDQNHIDGAAGFNVPALKPKNQLDDMGVFVNILPREQRQFCPEACLSPALC